MTARALAIVVALLVAAGDVRADAAVGYRVEESRGGAKALLARYDAPQLSLLQMLNRVDFDHLARLGRIVRPEAWLDDPLAYSPLPQQYAWGEDHAKLIVVDQPAQLFAAYERGRLVRWGPISSGRQESQTPPGLFHLNWRSAGRRSTIDPEWFMRWYFNFGNAEGLSFHEYALPGRPASHSCVRLLAVDARWLYAWGEPWRLDASGRRVLAPGTPVLILGLYDFTAPPPWRTAAGAARPIELPADPLERLSSEGETPMTVSEIMKTDVATCTVEDDLASVARTMKDRRCGFLPVIDSHGLVAGVITDRDVCNAAADESRAMTRRGVKEVMSHPVFGCLPDENVKVSIATMARRHVRRLTVLDRQGHLRGVLSMDDVIQAPARRGAPTAEEVVAALKAIGAPKTVETSV